MKNYLAGSVNSPIPIPRSYPSDIVKGKGSFVFDKNGERYIDMWMGYGALLFGHSDPKIIKLIRKEIDKGWFFSYQTRAEKELSVLLHETIPSAERVRFATSGSDAVAYAIRASRAFTQRNKVLSIKGGYHGVHERMIDSGGVLGSKPDRIAFNDILAATKALKTKQYACLILEPILANSGCTPPSQKYLSSVKNECESAGTVLIFDEIVTGFRIALGGAQSKFNVIPDMSLFSKAIAGGFPLSVVAGRKDILEQFIPNGDVFFAGTFNAHPTSLLIAKHIINRLKDGKLHKKLALFGENIRNHINSEIHSSKLNACVQGVGSMFTIAFGCSSFASGIVNEKYDEKLYEKFVSILAEHGILFPPLPTETVFLSPAHIAAQDEIKDSISKAFHKLGK